jgi:hypothetical protein
MLHGADLRNERRVRFGNAQCMAGLLLGQAEQSDDPPCRTDRPPGTGTVVEAVVSMEDHAGADGDLVTDDQRLKKRFPRGVLILRCGQDDGEDGSAGMPLDEAVSVVDVERIGNETVHQGRRHARKLPSSPDHRGLSGARHLTRSEIEEDPGPLYIRAGQTGACKIQKTDPRPLDHLRRDSGQIKTVNETDGAGIAVLRHGSSPFTLPGDANRPCHAPRPPAC